jgi:hypothetical protein
MKKENIVISVLCFYISVIFCYLKGSVLFMNECFMKIFHVRFLILAFCIFLSVFHITGRSIKQNICLYQCLQILLCFLYRIGITLTAKVFYKY